MSYTQDIRKKVGHDRIIMVGAGIIIYKDGRALLQRRKDNGLWAIHGGGVEIGEKVEDAARRELFEETGLIANKIELLGVFSGPGMMYEYPNGDKVSNVSVVYICDDFSGDIVRETDETLELCWFDIAEIPLEISPPDIECIASFIDWAKSRRG
jgi:ADP-ribose pyrophosphatase YjhB (NUDIX family)